MVYLVVGKMTGLLSRVRPGDGIEVWGPLGNGFPDLSGRPHVVLVAGGIGQHAVPGLRPRLLGRGYGGRPPATAAYRCITASARPNLAAGIDDFRAAGADVRIWPATTAAWAFAAT